MTKHTIRNIKQALEQRKETYKELGSALTQEAELARAEAESARSFLEGRIAALVAQQLPSLDAPALRTFDSIARDHNHPQPPGVLRDALRGQTAAATAEQAELEARHGTAATLAARRQELAGELAGTAATRSDLRNALGASNRTLRSADKLNDLLEGLHAPPLAPETLAQYERPPGRFAAAWRYLTDKPYREARPVLDGYARDGINLVHALSERSGTMAALETADARHQRLSATIAATGQAERAIATAAQAQKSERDILNEVRTAVTGMILSDGAIFHRADAAFPGAVDGGMKAMHTRMSLFGALADNIGRQKNEMDDISNTLDKPLMDLKKAVNNGNGDKKVEFDLESRASKLDRHQLVMTQRVQAARDLREASHSSTATSYSSNDSTSWLLWYMILANNNNSAAAADNSYFRAELMGVTPDNAASFGAASFGINGKNLSIPAEMASDLGYTHGVTAGDFNSLSGVEGGSKGAGLATGALAGAAFTEFNGLSQGLDLDRLRSDLSNFSSDLSSGSSGWSSSGSSYDSGSSWSSSGSYDSGGFSSSSCDSGSSCSF